MKVTDVQVYVAVVYWQLESFSRENDFPFFFSSSRKIHFINPCGETLSSAFHPSQHACTQHDTTHSTHLGSSGPESTPPNNPNPMLASKRGNANISSCLEVAWVIKSVIFLWNVVWLIYADQPQSRELKRVSFFFVCLFVQLETKNVRGSRSKNDIRGKGCCVIIHILLSGKFLGDFCGIKEAATTPALATVPLMSTRWRLQDNCSEVNGQNL